MLKPSILTSLLFGLIAASFLSGCVVDEVRSTEYDYYPAGYYSTSTSPNTYYYESGGYRRRHHRHDYYPPRPVINPPNSSVYQTNTNPNYPGSVPSINANTVPNDAYQTNTSTNINSVAQPKVQPLKPNAVEADEANSAYSTNTSTN